MSIYWRRKTESNLVHFLMFVNKNIWNVKKQHKTQINANSTRLFLQISNQLLSVVFQVPTKINYDRNINNKHSVISRH